VTSSPASTTATTEAHRLSVMEAEAEAIAAAVRSCPAVVDLAGGDFGVVATYLPGKRITGVRVAEDRIDVHLVGCYGIPIPALAAEVRTALTRLAQGRAVDIRVEDLGMGSPPPA
jgi:hypothetical protein